MNKLLKRIWKLVLLAVPLILALIGFYFDPPAEITGLGFVPAALQSAFTALTMYIMNYSEIPANGWIEVARWTAPLATASGLFLFINALRERFRNQLIRLRGQATAVYGPEEEKQALLSQLGSKGIDGKDHFIHAQQYILLGAEQENLDFYDTHRDALKNSTVYLKCRHLHSQVSSDPKLHLYNPEETAARLFWKEHCFYKTSAQNGHQMKLVILGFDHLGQELLTSALQSNLFDPDQRIEYHIFGRDDGFTVTHRMLSSISDPVIFHEESWYDQLPLLKQAQAVIVAEQENQLSLLQALQLALHNTPIYVFSAAPSGVGVLAHQNANIISYDWKTQAQLLENILGTQLFDRAMRLNLRYAHLYRGVPETKENKTREWKENLDTFTRYSNISAADYFEITKMILEADGCSPELSAVPAERFETLAELEHIRWCRYHYLNNWSYGLPKDGSSKDPVNRIHANLLPYGELADEVKEKDRENIRLLFSL